MEERLRNTTMLILLITLINNLINLNEAAANKNWNRQQYKLLENYMDPQADACDDYYQYACGNWEVLNVNQSFEDTFEKLDYAIDEEFKGILRKLNKRSNYRKQERFVQLIVDYYRSCVSLENYEPQLYLQWLEQHEGIIWPNIKGGYGRTRNSRRRRNRRRRSSKSSSNSSRSKRVAAANSEWLQLLAKLRKYGFNSVKLEEFVLVRKENARSSQIDIDKPGGMNDNFEALKKQEFEVVMNALGIEKRQRKLWQEIEEFEIEFIELLALDDDVGFTEITLKELNETWIENYIAIVLDDKEPLDPNMQISIQNLDYMKGLHELLQNYDDDFLRHYLMVRFLWYLHSDGPVELNEIYCITHIRDQLPLAMSWLYEQQNLELYEAATKNVMEIFVNLKQHFTQTLKANANNFNGKILKFLETKVQNMQLKVNNLPRNNTVDIVNSFYASLQFQTNDFYGNHLRLLRFQTEAEHTRLKIQLPQNAEEFFYLEEKGLASISTPYYLERNNIVVVPLVLLNLPIYHPKQHDILKYSLFGFLLAHEITHGFDDSGLFYDEYGNRLGPADVIKSNRIFDKNLNCLRSKNPAVIDERIADVNGLRLAYETYFEDVYNVNSMQQQQRPLYWSHIPAEELFFRNFALFFCGTTRSEKLLKHSSHGTYRSRLLEAVAHFSEFSRVYNCSNDSPMHRKNTCQLWR